MRTRVYFVNEFIISVVVAVLFLSATSAYADLEVDMEYDITNLDVLQRTANDVSFKAGLPPGDAGTWWIVNYDLSVWITPNIGGTRSTTSHTDGSGNLMYYDVLYDGISVPYGTTITIHVKGTVNQSGNLLKKWNVEWSYPNEPNTRGGAPDHGDDVNDTEWPPEEEEHNTTYTFNNIDPDIPVTISYLRFHEGPQRCDPCDPNYRVCVTSGQVIEEVTGPIVVDANSSYQVGLYGIPNTNRYIYVDGEMEYQMPGCDPAISRWIFGHEEPEPPAIVPTVSEWGLIIMAVLLLAAGAVVIVRRRRVAAA